MGASDTAPTWGTKSYEVDFRTKRQTTYMKMLAKKNIEALNIPILEGILGRQNTQNLSQNIFQSLLNEREGHLSNQTAYNQA